MGGKYKRCENGMFVIKELCSVFIIVLGFVGEKMKAF
jgi:hypothetical protein